MTYYVKNMVCPRCITAVKNTFEHQGFNVKSIELGEVEVEEDNVDSEKLQQVDNELTSLGFERIDTKTARLVERMKSIVIKKVHHEDEGSPKVNWSVLVADELHYDYPYLSSLFSSVEGITFEQYIIRQKIEKVKELIVYDELSLNEIAFKLGYSSAAHLSGQFRKITGFSPSAFRKNLQKNAIRKSIDDIS